MGDEATAGAKEKVPRSRQYPGFSLQETLHFAERLSKSVGCGLVSRESIAEGLGHSGISGTSAAKIGCLGHFGLIEKRGTAYQLSELAKRIVMPSNPNDREVVLATAEACKAPKLYAQLFARYQGHVVPSLLGNILAREYGILPKQAQEAANAFRHSAEYAGLLRGGVLFSEPEVDANLGADLAKGDPEDLAGASPIIGNARKDAEGGGEAGHHAVELSQHPFIPAIDHRVFAIPLTKGRTGSLQLPLGVAKSDIQRLLRWIELMEDVLTEESGENVSAL